jgi:hypothetical protein
LRKTENRKSYKETAQNPCNGHDNANYPPLDCHRFDRIAISIARAWLLVYSPFPMPNFPSSEIQHGHEQYDEKKILEDHDALLSLFPALILTTPLECDVMSEAVARDRNHYAGEQPMNPFAPRGALASAHIDSVFCGAAAAKFARPCPTVMTELKQRC